jgi:hypothetical protein
MLEVSLRHRFGRAGFAIEGNPDPGVYLCRRQASRA